VIDLFPAARPVLHALDPERAHDLTLLGLRLGLGPTAPADDEPLLRTRVFGLDIPNPIGLAAGFDKDAVAVDALLRCGFGFVEAGTVTPKPQSGNPKPRLFRLAEDRAVINRFGFNNRGLEAFAGRLAARAVRPGVVGANVGKNKDSDDAAADYAAGIRACAPHAAYLVVNVSSPNTPGLRALQGRQAMADLLDAVLAARAEAPRRPPLLVKVAPDLTPPEREDVAAVALERGIDGLIVGNTTLSRPELRSRHGGEAGGLSGAPLFALATSVLADFHRLTGGRLPLIGCGGVASGAEAYAKIRAGASLVQLYSALVYGGPALVGAIKRDLAARLRADGFASVAAAVGAR